MSTNSIESHNWIRKLADSKFNYWFGYVANFILVGWLISRAFYPGADSGTEAFTITKVLGLTALGIFIYTFTEYVFHRWLYHEVNSPFSTGHGLHHEMPKGLLGLPWYFPYPVIIGAYYGLAYLFNAPGSVGVLMGAWWLGFIGYCAVHHSTHHFNFKNKWFKGVKAHHRIHHVREETNFGVLTTFWDKVFGTEFKQESE
ncbi:hypothetical protein GW916_01440 [bacterium]|nr:hypothetical protein [bacterium]